MFANYQEERDFKCSVTFKGKLCVCMWDVSEQVAEWVSVALEMIFLMIFKIKNIKELTV